MNRTPLELAIADHIIFGRLVGRSVTDPAREHFRNKRDLAWAKIRALTA